MTNTALLDKCIKDSGLKKSFLAEQLGISAYGFSLKCSNKSEFKANEIETLCKVLKIGVKDRMAIFFAK
jgi:DNA-binding Xre family transcriptional regulator